MSGDLPSPWAQLCPRSVRLAPDGLLVPAATLRMLLRGERVPDLIYTGFALEPAVRDGATVRIANGGAARPGDLLLCDIDGWGDLLRCVGRSRDGAFTVALDALPGHRAKVPAERVLGVVSGTQRASLARLLAVCGLFSLRGPFASLRLGWRRVRSAPEFESGAAADDSVLEKYRQQVAGYRDLQRSMLTDELMGVLGRHVPRGGAVLVGGSGSGSEAIHLARNGYQVLGFDGLPEMVSTAGKAALAAGVRVGFVEAGIVSLDLPGRRFDAVYLTPTLYSFIALRERRIAVLRILARHLRAGGCLLLSVQPCRGPSDRVRTALAVLRRRLRGCRSVEAGDWYTWFLTPRGEIGYSYLHRFARGEVEAELRAAGYRVRERIGPNVLAVLSEPAGGP